MAAARRQFAILPRAAKNASRRLAHVCFTEIRDLGDNLDAQLTGHVVLEINGDEQRVEAKSFVEEEDGLWKFYGKGYEVSVTAELHSDVDAEGKYPSALEAWDVEDDVSVEIVYSSLAAAREDDASS